MILTDAGPLVALIDRSDTGHEACVAALDRISLPMVTTPPAFTEAIYLLGRFTGWAGQRVLWDQLDGGNLAVEEMTTALLSRTRELMQKYSDRPMGLADATLVAVAERDSHRQIFTLDSTDFGIYRLRGRRTLRVVPG